MAEKRKYPFDEVDVQCSVCKELLFDPRSFPCNHMVCLPCSLLMKSGQSCPECQHPKRSDGKMPKNHLVAKLIASCYPEEYEKRRKEHEIDLWIEEKRNSLTDLRITYGHISRTEILQIVKRLESVDAFTNFNSSRVGEALSNSCNVIFCDANRPQFTLNMEDSYFLCIWKGAMLYFSNRGTEWLKNEPL